MYYLHTLKCYCIILIFLEAVKILVFSGQSLEIQPHTQRHYRRISGDSVGTMIEYILKVRL